MSNMQLIAVITIKLFDQIIKIVSIFKSTVCLVLMTHIDILVAAEEMLCNMLGKNVGE